MRTLNAQKHTLGDSHIQLQVLNSEDLDVPRFASKLAAGGLDPFLATGIEIMQINVGKMCNQTCHHCHVDAGPDRQEIMTRETMEDCLRALANTDIQTVDITGGAPELNPHFRWLVEQVASLGRKIMVRCNLTIILSNPRFNDLPEFFARHHVEVIASLPYFSEGRTDRQRGDGVFAKSISALHMLNKVGYGIAGSSLDLNLVYNPAGAFLPGDQATIEKSFRSELRAKHGIEFSNLYAITNLPISRFLDYLLTSGNYLSYMEKLVTSFNITAARHVMCRNTISIGWDGLLYDCDFNQMLDLTVGTAYPKHIAMFDKLRLDHREIMIDQHCYGCTAGAGSSCGGAVIEG